MAEIELPQSVEHLNEYLDLDEFHKELMNRKNPIVFWDIETKPADADTLDELFQDVEIQYPPYPGEFDPTSVKYGNTKDQAKRDAKLKESEEKHATLLANYDNARRQAASDAWNAFVADATLHAETASVCAIGYGLLVNGELEIYLDIDPHHEVMILDTFWNIEKIVRSRAGQMISFNGEKFDAPFVTRRSWVRGVPCRYLLTKYRVLEDHMVDAKKYWNMGGGWGDSISLKKLTKCFGVTGKLEGMTGDQFHKVLSAGDMEKARQYLAHDIIALEGVARRMGMIPTQKR